MPAIKLNPTRTKKLLRQCTVPSHVAEQLGVNTSTIYRFIKKEQIDMYLLVQAQKTSFKRVARAMEDLGCTHSHIARSLACTPQYISQLLTPEPKPEQA